MLVLGLDTTGPDCSVAIIRGQEVLAHLSDRIGRGHAEHLGPMVLSALDEADVKAEAIECVAVCTGPGSFTGLRVALSFAKGFALPRRLPVIGVDRLTLALFENPAALIVCDIKRGEAAMARSGEKPVIVPHAEVDAIIGAFSGPVVRDPVANVSLLAKQAQDLNPANFPADAFYGRKPDAKLPGGRDPE